MVGKMRPNIFWKILDYQEHRLTFLEECMFLTTYCSHCLYLRSRGIDYESIRQILRNVMTGLPNDEIEADYGLNSTLTAFEKSLRWYPVGTRISPSNNERTDIEE